MMPHAALVKFVGVPAELRPLGDALALEFEELRLDRAGDRVSYLVLQLEQIGEGAIVPLGHYVMVRVGLDQLHGDAHPTARFAHAAFEDIAHAQFLANLLDVDGLALVGEGRVAGDHREGAPAGEHRNDVLGDAVGEKLLLRITAEIFEGQDRYGAAIIEPGRGRRRERRRRSARALLHDLTAEPEDADRLGDVFEVMRPEVLEVQLYPAGDAVTDEFRDVDAAG